MLNNVFKQKGWRINHCENFEDGRTHLDAVASPRANEIEHGRLLDRI